jgi:hypothetical protein
MSVPPFPSELSTSVLGSKGPERAKLVTALPLSKTVNVPLA